MSQIRDYLTICAICRNEGGNSFSTVLDNIKIKTQDCDCERCLTIEYKACKEHLDEYKFTDKKIDIVYLKCRVCDFEGFVGRRGELLIREENLYKSDVKP